MSKVRTKSVVLLVIAALGVVAGMAWAGGDWGGARDAVEALKKRQMALRKLTPEETRKIVTAICEADDKEREKVGEDAATRVSNVVTNEVGELRNMRDYAYRLLDDVIADDNLKDRRDEAKQMRSDVEKRWDSIMMMVEGAMKGANNPLVSYLIGAGQKAHKDYQGHCDASEIPTGRRIADCVMASGDTCRVIELKPNNSKAISGGRRQLEEQLEDLNNELKKPDSPIIKELINKKSDFKNCKRFEGRIDCYKLCPDIDEEGKYRAVSPDWKSDCS